MALESASMRFHPRHTLACLPLLLNTANAEIHAYFFADSVTYSEPVSIKSILDDWSPPFAGGEAVLTHNRVELGARWRDWWFGVVERYDYRVELAPQTAELLYLTKNRLPLAQGSEYEIYMDAGKLRSNGVIVGRTIEATPSLRFSIAVSLLRTGEFTFGSGAGAAVVVADNDYDFEFDVDYIYSHDGLFGRTVSAPSGSGVSADFSVSWNPTERWTFRANLLDIASRMEWDAAPRTVATASSDTKSFDEQGYVRYDPVVSGFESYEEVSRRLTRKSLLRGEHHFNGTKSALIEYEDFEVARFVSVGAGWSIRERHRFEAMLNYTTEGLVFRYLVGELRVELSTDHLQTQKMHSFVVNLAYRSAF
ncbi:MAG: hypothetical protein ACWGPN_05600 [Gammaproteobacteria bacterium]